MSGSAVWVSAARPRTLPAAVAPVIVGSALAAHVGRFHLPAAALCLGFALLVQIGTNFANDYYDFIKGADTPARIGPRRAVGSGLVAPVAMHRAMLATFALAFVVGLGLLPYGGPWLLAIGLACIACGIAYTAGPLPLAYVGLGDLFVFAFFGLVAVGATYFVQAGILTADAFLAGAAVGLLAANILLVNNYRDVETDAAAGKRTLPVRWGRAYARAQFTASLLFAFAVPIVFSSRGYGPWALLPLALLPWAWRHARRLKRETTAPGQIALLADTGKLLAGYAVLLAIGIW